MPGALIAALGAIRQAQHHYAMLLAETWVRVGGAPSAEADPRDVIGRPLVPRPAGVTGQRADLASFRPEHYSEGYKVGRAGGSRTECPYLEERGGYRGAWLWGHAVGQRDHEWLDLGGIWGPLPTVPDHG